MGGLAILIIIIAYIWSAIAISKWARRHLARRTALAISLTVFLLPFVDAVAGRMILKAKCGWQGSITILESIPDVKGIGVDYVSTDGPSYYGYQFVEGQFNEDDYERRLGNYTRRFGSPPGIYKRAELDPASGQIKIKSDIGPKALYLLMEDSAQRQDSFYFIKQRISVNERLTGREIAFFHWFRFRGGWAERFLAAFTDAGSFQGVWCGSYKEEHEKIIAMLHSALRPAPITPSSEQGR